MKINGILLILSLATTVWLANSLVRVENQRYAMQVGMCRHEVGGWNYQCLKQVETRTSWVWHLFYALTE
jgi:hypothetical protein